MKKNCILGWSAALVVSALAMAASATAETMPGGKWQPLIATDQMRTFLKKSCTVEFDPEEIRALEPKAASIDSDGQTDYYSSLSPFMLEIKHCDLQAIRFSWISSDGYAFRAPNGQLADPSETSSPPVDAAKPDAAVAPDQPVTKRVPADTPATSSDTTAPNHPAYALPAWMADKAPGVLFAIAAAAFVALMVVVAILLKMSKAAREEYGYSPFINWLNLIHIITVGSAVTAAVLVIGGDTSSALICAAVGAVCWLAMLIINIRKTNFGLGLAISVVQPFVFLFGLVALLFLNGFLQMGAKDRRMAEGLRRRGVID